MERGGGGTPGRRRGGGMGGMVEGFSSTFQCLSDAGAGANPPVPDLQLSKRLCTHTSPTSSTSSSPLFLLFLLLSPLHSTWCCT